MASKNPLGDSAEQGVPGASGGNDRRSLERRAEDRKHTLELIVQLLKYPILVFAIFLGLLGANKVLGMQFGTILSIGTDGVKFAERSDSLSEQVVQLRTQLSEAQFRLDVLEKRSSATSAPSVAQAASRAVEEKSFDLLQQAGAVSSLVRSIQGKEPKALVAGREGYIWIGNYDRQSGWARAKIAVDGAGTLPVPNAIGVGDQFTVTGNMVLRNGAPTDDDAYFTSRQSIGVVPQQARVVVVEVPRSYNRGYAVQWWMKVRISG